MRHSSSGMNPTGILCCEPAGRRRSRLSLLSQTCPEPVFLPMRNSQRDGGERVALAMRRCSIPLLGSSIAQSARSAYNDFLQARSRSECRHMEISQRRSLKTNASRAGDSNLERHQRRTLVGCGALHWRLATPRAQRDAQVSSRLRSRDVITKGIERIGFNDRRTYRQRREPQASFHPQASVVDGRDFDSRRSVAKHLQLAATVWSRRRWLIGTLIVAVVAFVCCSNKAGIAAREV